MEIVNLSPLTVYFTVYKLDIQDIAGTYGIVNLSL